MPQAVQSQGNAGEPATRIDAVLKVTGRAKYAADFALARPAYAVLVTSAITLGAIEALDLAEARTVEGVLEIYSYLNCAGRVKRPSFFFNGGFASTTIQPLDSSKIWHDGQIVAMVVAETFEAAREAAFKVEISYRAAKASASFDASSVEARALGSVNDGYVFPAIGDAEAALSTADVRSIRNMRLPRNTIIRLSSFLRPAFGTNRS
jgi:xanthine dehydrogenase YagR molybdenum-binding subunit